MKRLIIVSVLALFVMGCNKKEAVELNFDAVPTAISYNVGDTVRFDIAGNPDQLTFYSGEEGSQYIYRDRIFIESNEITLEFASHKRYGTVGDQPKPISLFASQQYNGDKTTFTESDWVDISEAFTFSPLDNGDNYTPSGVVNLLELSDIGFTVDKEKLIYFAFKYEGMPSTSAQPRVWINQFDINTISTDGKVVPVLTLSNAEWSTLLMEGSAVNWIIDGEPNTTRLRHQGIGGNNPGNEAWVMTKGFFLTSAIPDRGVALKNMSTRMNEFTHVYNEPGTYTVTFIASNENVYGGEKVIKEMEITVNP